MKIVRRLLGILVMIAGILGLVISLAGLVGLWMAKPVVVSSLTSTVDTLNASISTSQNAMEVTQQALGATVDSVDALAVMLDSTATSVEDTAPVLQQVNTLLGENLPATIESAAESLKSAQQAAVVLDSSVQSLQAFQFAMSAVPGINAFVQTPTQTYNPEKPMAESLGEVAANLEDLPAMFVEMSQGMDKADDNLGTVESSLTTMSGSARVIAQSLEEYQSMIAQSQASMENLAPVLANIQNNLDPAVNYVSIGLSLFFFWLLAIQVVVLSQGWELYQGTAGRMEGGSPEALAPQPVS